MNQFMFLNWKIKIKEIQAKLSFHWDQSQKSFLYLIWKTIQKKWIGISWLMKFSGNILKKQDKVFYRVLEYRVL